MASDCQRIEITPSGVVSPIHEALREYLDFIRLKFAPTRPAFRRDRAKTATSREKTVEQFLQAFLPIGWSVKKGLIYDKHGNVSAEVDCAICVPQHPPCHTPQRDLILAEGVHAAVEVKPTIRSLGDKGEFARVLRQARTVKLLQRQLRLVKADAKSFRSEEAHRIPYVVFADKVADLEKSAEFMDKQRRKNGWSEWDLPDVVLGYRDGIV